MEPTQLTQGLVSIVITTYNRGERIINTIESLLEQTYQNIEIIVVDNGCTDNTPEVLDRYRGKEYADKIRIFRLEENRRFAGGCNFGLDQIRGEWFTIIDDDDTAYPYAIATMMKLPQRIDPTITAVTCNTIDSSTHAFAGKGISEDGYLSMRDMVSRCRGEFWGITKTEVLGDLRLNEKLLGYEDSFWYQVSMRSKRYYIHQALRVWTQDQGPTITSSLAAKDRKMKASIYKELANEDVYWYCLAEYKPSKFKSKCFKGLIYALMNEDKRTARLYLKKLKNYSRTTSFIGKLTLRIPKPLLRSLFFIAPL